MDRLPVDGHIGFVTSEGFVAGVPSFLFPYLLDLGKALVDRHDLYFDALWINEHVPMSSDKYPFTFYYNVGTHSTDISEEREDVRCFKGTLYEIRIAQEKDSFSLLLTITQEEKIPRRP